MERALAVAKLYNAQVNQGGRTTPDQHLSDLARETQQQTLLNRARQRGFTSPQQDFAYRQQEITQRRLQNIAAWEGYQSKDQYLNSQQRERGNLDALNTAWARRAQLVRDNTQAAVQHTNVLQGTTKSAGQLASQGSTIADASVKDAQAQLKKTLDDITHARIQGGSQDSSAVISQFRAIKDAIDDLQARTKNLDFQPEGLEKLKTAFTDAQSYAARVFPDIQAKSKSSAQGSAADWQRFSNTFHDVFAVMRVSANDAAADVEGRFAQTAARIRGAFTGMGGGAGGGGVASVFADMAGAIGGFAGDIPGKVGLITAAILALIQILPALAAGLGSVASLAATLPDFLGAAAGAFVTFQAAIMPVIQALQAYTQLLKAQEAIRSGDLQTVMQQQQAYHSLADAQFSLAQAVTQGANQQVVAAHNVAEAQYALRQAYFQSGITQIQTAMELASSQHSLQDANFAVTQSQYALTMAWQQARFQLQQLQLTVSGASLNLRGAQLSLEEAQQNYAQVMAQSTSTALQRAQAAFAVQQAEQQLKQTLLTNKENEQQLANVRKYGMQQVFGVTQAQHALVDAQFSQIQAQKQLVVTEKEAANAQIQAAHAIMDAIYGVQQARFQQAQGAVQSAHTTADAIFSVQQAQEQLALDAQAGGAAAVSAYEAFQVALDQLSPAARKAVKSLEPLFIWWQNNTKAQQAFFGQLSGSLAALGKNGINLIRPLNQMLDAIAGALGSVAGKFLDWFLKLANSPVWKVFTHTSVVIIRDFGEGALLIAKGLSAIALAAAPLARALSGGLLEFAREFRQWAVQQAKPGSILHVLMNEAVPALHALAQLLKSVVDFFLILAGGTPTYNKQGALTGVIPSDSQNSAFATFTRLLGVLSNAILPNLALTLNRLASPQLANALITLLTAMSVLLLQVVSSPGFMTAFITFVRAFSALVNAFGWLAQNTPLGSMLGVIAGAFVTMSVLKFTGILALLTHLREAAAWVKGIKDAEGVFGKLGAIFGGKGGPGGTPGSGVAAGGKEAAVTIADAMTAAGEKAAASIGEAMTGAGATAAEEIGTAETAGGATGGAVGGGEAAVGGLATGGLLGRLGTAGIGLLIADAVARGLTSLFPKQPAADQRRALAQGPGWAQSIDKAIFGPGIVNFVAWWDKHVKEPVDNWVTKSLPHAWAATWLAIGEGFGQYVGDPVKKFFSTLIPDWLGGAGRGWSGLWQNAQNVWINDIWHPLDNFFNQDIPNWWHDLLRFWKNLWDTAWGDFKSGLLDPVGNWFTRTLPSAIENAFKHSVNWVISNVLNRVIGWINDATKLVGIPSIPKVPTLAGGGQMPHRGGGPHQDNRLARVSDGEYVINAEATRKHLPLIEAINAQGYAHGGGIGGFFSGLWSDVTSGAGDLWGAVSSLFSGAGGALARLKNLILRDGAVPVVNAMWSHLVDPLLRVAGINSTTEKQIVPHLIGSVAADLHKGLDKALAGAPSGGGIPIHVVGGVPGNVASWTPEVRSVLAQTGEPASDLGAVLHRIAQESGGNPNIVNKWDSNWLAGHPSVGLMQVIQGTYDAYAGPYRNTGPFLYGVSVDPIANIYAGVNYAKHAYFPEPLYDVMMQPGGYAGGGPVGMPAMAFAGLPSLSLSRPRIPGFGGSTGTPRSMSDAAAATQGGGGGLSMGDIHIHNPLPERAGDSITRSVTKLAFLAGRAAV